MPRGLRLRSLGRRERGGQRSYARAFGGPNQASGRPWVHEQLAPGAYPWRRVVPAPVWAIADGDSACKGGSRKGFLDFGARSSLGEPVVGGGDKDFAANHVLWT